jgi:cytochrome P450
MLPETPNGDYPSIDLTSSAALPLNDPRVIANPYPFYSLLLTQAPVCRTVLPQSSGGLTECYVVTGYEDVTRVAGDARTFIRGDYGRQILSGYAEDSPIAKLFSYPIFWLDGKPHDEVRHFTMDNFTQPKVEKLQPYIRSLAHRLLDELSQRPQTSIDVITDFALPLAFPVICQIFGVSDDEIESFRHYANAIVRCLDPMVSEEVKQEGQQAGAWMLDYFTALRSDQRQLDQTSFLAALLASIASLDPIAQNSTLFTLLVAGYHNNVNLIGNSVRAFLENSDQLEGWQQDPKRRANMVDECMRYYSPTQLIPRQTIKEVTLSGTVIPQNSIVLAFAAAANRDPRKFPRADQFDLTNPFSRQHLGFGKGMYSCFGAPLAFLQADIALTTLWERVVNPQLEGLTAPMSLLLWGPQSLRMSYQKIRTPV